MKIAEKMREGYRKYESLSHGVLHGDPHNYNIRYTDGLPTLFDFDSFGYGPQMYDLGEQVWNISVFDFITEDEKAQQIRWLMNGYESVRPLDEAVKASIPFYAALRSFRLCGVFLMSRIRNGEPSADSEDVRGSLAFTEHLLMKDFDL